MPEADCRDCGACCVHAGEVAVDVSEPIPRYLTRSVRRSMGFFSDDHYDTRRMARVPHDGVDTRCVALRGVVGEACRCNIYDQRPEACRGFEVGSPSCLESRQAAGVEDRA